MRFILTALLLTLVAAPVAAQTEFSAPLVEGAQEVPPVATTAFGWGTFRLNANNTVDYDVRICGLVGNAAHLHAAPAGQNGGIHFALTGGPIRWTGTTPALTAQQITTLQSRGYYVNVHTNANPGGEVRGQVVPDSSFGALLQGSSEVPPVATGAGGSAALTVNANNTITYMVNTTGLAGTAAHIHAAPAGQNGGVQFPLAGGPAIWAGTTAAMTADQYSALQADGMYINVHTNANPGGEIRGQVLEGPSNYGAECGRPGASLSLGAFAVSGGTISASIAGGKPGGTGFLAVTTAPGARIKNNCCILLTPPTVKEKTISLNAAGNRAFTVPVPNIAGGGVFYLQYIGLDNTAPNGQFYTTNAVKAPVHDL